MRIRAWFREGFKDYRAAPFHCFPMFFAFAAAIAMWIAPHLLVLPLDVNYNDTGQFYDGGYDAPSYGAWLCLAIASPALVMLSYWLPGHRHGSRYMCLWFRFAGDSGTLFALLALDLSTIKVVSDQGLYRQILFAGYICFVAAMLVRDVVMIVESNRLANRIDERRAAQSAAEGQD